MCAIMEFDWQNCKDIFVELVTAVSRRAAEDAEKTKIKGLKLLWLNHKSFVLLFSAYLCVSLRSAW